MGQGHRDARSATALRVGCRKGGLAAEARTRDRSVLKERKLIPALQGGVGQVAPRRPQGCPCGWLPVVISVAWDSKHLSLICWNWK